MPSGVSTEAAERRGGLALAAPEGVGTVQLKVVLRRKGPPPELHEGGLFLPVPSRRDTAGPGGQGADIAAVVLQRVDAQIALGVRGATAHAGVLPDLQRPRWGSVERNLHRENPAGCATATSHGQRASPGDPRRSRRPHIGTGFPAQGGLQGGLIRAVRAPSLWRCVTKGAGSPGSIEPGLACPAGKLNPAASA